MKNRTVIILVSILIIMIIVTIYLCNYKKPEQSNTQYIVETVEDNTVITDNSYDFFSKYGKGCVSSKIYYETISNFYKNTLPNYYNSLVTKTNEELKQYYNSNTEQIKNDIKIENEEEFIKFVQMLSKLKNKNLVLEKLTIKDNTVVNEKDYVSANIIIKYAQNNEINMMIKVYKNAQNNGKNIEFCMVK